MRQRAVGAKWWTRLEQETDPISLEPLAELGYPPFELSNDAAGRVEAWFDGQVLAAYLVATGSFEHPVSRRTLTPDDCRRLDAYLQGPSRPRRPDAALLS